MRLAVVAILLAVGACAVDSEVSRAVGAQCQLQSECEERCLSGGDYPDGFCTVSCDRDADCPGGAACVENEGGGVCLFPCAELADCEFLGAGWECRDRSARPGGEDVKVCRGDG